MTIDFSENPFDFLAPFEVDCTIQEMEIEYEEARDALLAAAEKIANDLYLLNKDTREAAREHADVERDKAVTRQYEAFYGG